MSDPATTEAVDTAVKAGGGGLLVLFFTRLFKSGDTLAVLMAQNAATDATLKQLIGAVAALEAKMEKVQERSDKALGDHRIQLNALKHDVNSVAVKLGLAEKTREISELKAELEAATEAK